MTMRHLILTALALVALASPATAQLRPGAFTTLRTTDTSANSLVVGGASGATTGTGGIKAGPIVASQLTVNAVGIIGSDGRIPAISSTYFASLSGANLTGITEASITDSTILARVGSTETVSAVWTFTAAPVISMVAPIVKWTETDAAVNSGKWWLAVDGNSLALQARDDAETGWNNVLTVGRTGTTVDSITLGSRAIFPAGSIASPSIALTEAVGGTNNDTGITYASGSVAIVNNGTQVALFNNSGSSSISGSFNIAGTAASTALLVTGSSATPIVLNRTVSDGTLIDLQQDGASEGSISISGVTVAYNTFMGAHYTQLQEGQQAPEPGTVVVTAGRSIPNRPRTLTRADAADGEMVADSALPIDPDAERFVYVEPSSTRNQRGVYGVWFADLGRTAAGMSWGDPHAEVYQVASLGLTTVWVTDTCGKIEAGMWLATSPVAGLAEAQCTVVGNGKPGYDPVARDYTLGKALIPVDWSKVPPDADGVRKLKIPVTVSAG